MHLYAEENPTNRHVQREKRSTLRSPNGTYNIQYTKKYRVCPNSKFTMDLATALLVHSTVFVTQLRTWRRLLSLLLIHFTACSVHHYLNINCHLPKSAIMMHYLLRLWLFPTKTLKYALIYQTEHLRDYSFYGTSLQQLATSSIKRNIRQPLL